MAADAPVGPHESRALEAGIRLAAPLHAPPPVWQDGEDGVAIQSSDGFGVARAARTGPPALVFQAGADSFPTSDRQAGPAVSLVPPFGLFDPVF